MTPCDVNRLVHDILLPLYSLQTFWCFLNDGFSDISVVSIKDNQGKTALDWARDKELFMIEKHITEHINSNDNVSDSPLPDITIRELQEKLRKSEQVNEELRKNIEELNIRIREQDHKIHSLRSR